MNKYLASIFAFCVITLPLEGSAATLSYSAVWNGSTITITYPDKVTFNTGFDLGFTIDSSTMTSPESVAFNASLEFSNTVDLSQATWGYDFSSTWPGASASFSGALNDSSGYVMSSPITGGYHLAFADPLNIFGGTYSWLWRQDMDRVTWTIHNSIIQGDTNVTLKLDDWGWVGGPGSHSVLVIDPPVGALTPASPVPEPSSAWLMAGGLLLLAGHLCRRSAANIAA